MIAIIPTTQDKVGNIGNVDNITDHVRINIEETGNKQC
jgi:hypothetical protein